jgi:hypothetical protein
MLSRLRLQIAQRRSRIKAESLCLYIDHVFLKTLTTVILIR